jgi:hypothetical protein
MPGRDENARSLTGAWHLFLDRSDAMRFFDVSVDGFWRSFGAILLILLAYILVVLSDRARIVTDALFSEGFVRRLPTGFGSPSTFALPFLSPGRAAARRRRTYASW